MTPLVLLGLGMILGISTLIGLAFNKSLLSQYLPIVLDYSSKV